MGGLRLHLGRRERPDGGPWTPRRRRRRGSTTPPAAALDEQAGRAVNADAQALLEEGADLVREVGAQVTSVEGQIGDLVDSLLTTLLVIVGMLTVLLAYLIVIHGGIWTLGRHWRRD